jgi:hypothetical protein
MRELEHFSYCHSLVSPLVLNFVPADRAETALQVDIIWDMFLFGVLPILGYTGHHHETSTPPPPCYVVQVSTLVAYCVSSKLAKIVSTQPHSGSLCLSGSRSWRGLKQ